MFASMLLTLLLATVGFWLVALLTVVVWRFRAARIRRNVKSPVIAFFHPYCSGGGGGERVLWKAIEVLGNVNVSTPTSTNGGNKESASATTTFPTLPTIIIYTVDPPSPVYSRNLLQHVQERFSIHISDKLKIHFVHLHEHKYLLDPSPRLSLLVESAGAMRLAWRGLRYSQQQLGLLPDVFVDTTGCAFTFLPASLYFGCRIAAYVHYPTISTDMLQMVWQRRRAAYNHAADIAQSRFKTAVKLLYYTAFAVVYGLVGSLATLVMVNSTWTYNHIAFLWKGPAWRKAIQIVYPPCAVTDLQSLAQDKKMRLPIIISIGQFRPEKDHVLQIEALARLLHQQPDLKRTAKLVLIGSCRNADDQARLGHLQQLVKELDLLANVEFCVNQPYSTVKEWLGKARVGIHTMWNEHFGIGIVEMMAAGLLVVAHNSGGPQTDIIDPQLSGFLATTVDEYATALYKALTMSPPEAVRMQEAAVESSKRFSDEVFAQSFRDAVVQAKIL